MDGYNYCTWRLAVLFYKDLIEKVPVIGVKTQHRLIQQYIWGIANKGPFRCESVYEPESCINW